MGTLIRSAVAFDRPQLIVISGVDPYNPKVVQASAGTIGQAALIFMTWQELYNHKQRPPIHALVSNGGTPPDHTSKETLLLVGGEANGLPDPVLKQCDRLITLGMPGPAESLNAAIAGSIALYLSVNN
jgi:TrmH family RNA methyltransferase